MTVISLFISQREDRLAVALGPCILTQSPRLRAVRGRVGPGPRLPLQPWP